MGKRYLLKNKQVNRFPYDRVVSAVLSNFAGKDASQIKILELGCGTSNNILFLAQEGFQAYGVDGSETAIRLGEDILRANNLTANLKCLDFSDLSEFGEDYFDMIIDRGSIMHNRRSTIMKTMAEVCRVLKPGGYLFSQFFSDQNSSIRFGKSNGDGSYFGFTDGYLKGYDFTFFFASRDDIAAFFEEDLDISSLTHELSTSHIGALDTRGTWTIHARKPLR